jgi:hypothetical protein
MSQSVSSEWSIVNDFWKRCRRATWLARDENTRAEKVREIFCSLSAQEQEEVVHCFHLYQETGAYQEMKRCVRAFMGSRAEIDSDGWMCWPPYKAASERYLARLWPSILDAQHEHDQEEEET